jgi:hypothetical protein
MREERINTREREALQGGVKAVVYARIMDVEISRGVINEFRCRLDVAGFLPRDLRDVVNFVTELFRTMRFNYMNVSEEDLSTFGYFVAELSRDKVYLATIPLNTYYIDTDWRGQGIKPVDLFVDVGSPFKHIYYVLEEPVQNAYGVIGLSRVEHIELYVKFFRDEHDFCKNVWHPCTPETLSEKVRDSAIHIEVDPYLREDKRELLTQALRLAGVEKTSTSF